MYSETTCGSWNFVQQDKTSNFTFFQWNEFGPSAGLMADLGSVRVTQSCLPGSSNPALSSTTQLFVPALHEDRNKNYFSCLCLTRLRTKWLWSSQIATLLVFKLYLSGQAGSVPFRLCAQKLNTRVWEACSGLIPTIQVSNRPALNQSISRANRIFGSGFSNKLGHLLK